MKKYQSSLSQLHKKRPSIEFSPTLQKPVYILTKNLNGSHIIQLIQQLDKHKIPYQMQQETQTLGFKLNQRFFVIVDNRYGEVTLGAQFGSILMTVVGYPRIGKNKKNKYFEKPIEIINFYQVFKNNKDISQREKQLIHKQYSDIIIEKESSSKLKSKITVRSISKYKSPQKDNLIKVSEIKQKRVDKKLIIIQDKHSQIYSKLCNYLSTSIPKESLSKIQKVEEVEEVRQLTLFSTNKAQIYYLVNQKNEKQLLETIFIGEVLIFNTEIVWHNLKSVFAQPKIYGITSEQKQIIKMLQTIGLVRKQQSQIAVSKLPQNSIINSQIPKINIIQSNRQKKQQKAEQSKKQQIFLEVSKIEGVQSVISEEVKQIDLNISVLSQNSSKIRRKVKRINKSKKKDSEEQANTLNQYYMTEKKQNQPPKTQKYELRTSRKKTLRTQEKQSLEKPKKSLKFVDLPKQETIIKRLRPISRFQPKIVQIVIQSNETMTQNQYFPKQIDIVKSSILQPQNRRITSPQNEKSVLQNYLKNAKGIDAILYRQFIQKFKSLTEKINENPSLLLPEMNKQIIIQPFFNLIQFDRYVRRIKRKLKESGHNCEQFKFVAFVIDQELAAFEKYCFEKNKSYEQEGYQKESWMKASNFSSTFSSLKQPKITIFLFVDSSTQFKQKTLNYETIKLIQYEFPRVAQFTNMEKPLNQMSLKLIQTKLVDDKEYFYS